MMQTQQYFTVKFRVMSHGAAISAQDKDPDANYVDRLVDLIRNFFPSKVHMCIAELLSLCVCMCVCVCGSFVIQ